MDFVVFWSWFFIIKVLSFGQIEISLLLLGLSNIWLDSINLLNSKPLNSKFFQSWWWVLILENQYYRFEWQVIHPKNQFHLILLMQLAQVIHICGWYHHICAQYHPKWQKTTRSDKISTKSGEIFVGSSKIFTNLVRSPFSFVRSQYDLTKIWTILPQATIIQGDNEFDLSDHPK